MIKYFKNIYVAARTIFEGLTITASHCFRTPITIQYPDRTPKPFADMIPERFRGMLSCNTGLCTACKLCEMACPIDCIKIDITKVEQGMTPDGSKAMPAKRFISTFDIDQSKCMFCGLCTEACPTKAIAFTKEFARSTERIEELTSHFIKGDPVEPFRPITKKITPES